MRCLLANALLLDPESVEPQLSSLLIEDGRISAKLAPDAVVPDVLEYVDLRQRRLAPGFLDLHFHGRSIFAGPQQLPEALRHDAAELLRHGTTAFLATSVAWPRRRLAEFVTHFAQTLDAGLEAGAVPLGIHLEGPWIHPGAAGAQPAEAIRAVDRDEVRELFSRAEGSIRMVTFAPEVEGVEGLLKELRVRGIVAALGHSRADEAQIGRAIQLGMTHVTHIFNAMGPMRHREPGVPGLVLSDDRLSCDLICDGVHVHPRMVKLAARVARDRLLLISDRIDPLPERAAEGFGAGLVEEAGGAFRLADGRLAGSSLGLDRAIDNAVGFGAMTQLEAVAACTLRPARLLGVEASRGTLRPGARADLAVLDAAGRVVETWLAGRRVHPRTDQPG